MSPIDPGVNGHVEDDAFVVDLWAQAFGEVEVGVWCETCALPSSARAVAVFGSGGTVLACVQVVSCSECGQREETRLPGVPDS